MPSAKIYDETLMAIKIKPADKYFSQWIRLRDQKCLRCHSPVKLNSKGLPVSHQASHFKGRAKGATRFEPFNIDTLCGGCHMYLGGQPDEHYFWQVERKGQAMVDKLILMANTPTKVDWKAEEIYWKQKLKQDFNV